MDIKIIDFNLCKFTYRVATFSFVVEDLGGLIVRKAGLFKKGQNMWINLPSFTDDTYGKKTWHTFIDFTDEKFKSKLKDAVLTEAKDVYAQSQE
jgi:hypothetical protein